MKAILIDPRASSLLAPVDVEDDPVAWRNLIGNDCIQLGHLTLKAGAEDAGTGRASDRESVAVIAVFDDHGEVAGQPAFTLWSEAFGQRMTIFGRALIVASDESLFDVSAAKRLSKMLDLRFDD